MMKIRKFAGQQTPADTVTIEPDIGSVELNGTIITDADLVTGQSVDQRPHLGEIRRRIVPVHGAVGERIGEMAGALEDAVACVGDSTAITLDDLAFAIGGGDLTGLERALRSATALATHDIPLRPNRVHPLWRTDHNNNVGINAPEIDWSFEPDVDWIDITTVHKGGLFGTDSVTLSLISLPPATDSIWMAPSTFDACTFPANAVSNNAALMNST